MPTFEQFKKQLQDAGVNWSDDKIKSFIENQINAAEQGISSPTLRQEFGPQFQVPGAPSGAKADQNAVMDFLGNALWGATEGGSWGLATGLDIAKGGAVEKAVSLGYSDKWEEESFAGKAGYILASSIAMLGGFAATGGLISTVGGATRVAAPALAKAGAKQLAKSTTDRVVKGLGRTAVDKTLKDAVLKTVSGETGEVFATSIMRSAADDILSIGRGQWRNVPLKEKMLSYGAGRGSKQIARKELMAEAHGNISKDIQKRLVENLAKTGASPATIAKISDDVIIAKSEQLAKEVMGLAQTYNSRNFNLALSAKIAQMGKGQTPAEISKAAQRWGAGIAEGTLFAIHGLGTHSWRNISYNIFADPKKVKRGLVDHEGSPLTASGVVTETLMSFATGAALGSVARFIGQGAGKESSGIFHPAKIEKFRTYAGKETGISHDAMEKTGWLAKDFPTIIQAIRKYITPTKYKSKEQLKRMAEKDRGVAQDAIRLKAKIIWDSADGGKGMAHLLPEGFNMSTFKGLSKNVNRSIEETGQLIKFLSNTEKEFAKEIVPWLGREMTQDFFQSLPRMVVGSTIMNAQTFHQNYVTHGTLWGEDPKETIAHILTGMWFTKKPHIFLGGEKTTYFNMQNYRKYMNGLEVLGYDTKHVRKWKAFIDSDNLSPVMKRQLKLQHKGFKNLNDTFTNEDGESLFRDSDQLEARQIELNKAGQEPLAPINKHITTDRELAAGDKKKMEDIEAFEFKQELIASSLKHLYPDRTYENISWNEYVEMKKKVLNLELDGKTTNIDNLQSLIEKTFSDERNTTSSIYSDALGDFFESISSIFNLKKTGTIDNIIIVNPELRTMLRKHKKTSDPQDQLYMQIAIDAFDSAVSRGFIKESTAKTEGLTFEMTDELMTNVKNQVVDSLERLHTLQFGTSDWRNEFFGGAVEKSTTRDNNSRLHDMFVDVGMLGRETFYDAIQTNLLHKRVRVGEMMVAGDSIEEGLMSESERTEYKSIHSELEIFFNKGLPLIEVEKGGTSEERIKASETIERIFKAFNIENEVRVAGEKNITLEDANKIIKRLSDYTGDLFKSEESFIGFTNYLNESAIMRALGELKDNHSMKSALIEFLDSNSNLGSGRDIKVWKAKDAVGAIMASKKIGDSKKKELVDFYNKFVENLNGAPKISVTNKDHTITSDYAVDVIARMSLASETLTMHEHLKTGEEFAMKISSSNELLQKIATGLGKDLGKVQEQLENAAAQELDVNAKSLLEQQKESIENKKQILENLETSYVGMYRQYLEALGGDVLLLRELVTQRPNKKTVNEIVNEMYQRLLDKEGFDNYDSLNNFAAEIETVRNEAILARNNYLERKPGDYNEIRSSTSSVSPLRTRKDVIGLSRNSFAEEHGLGTIDMKELFNVSEEILRGAKAHARPSVQNLWDDYLNLAIRAIGDKKTIDLQELITTKNLEELAAPLATYIATDVVLKNKTHNVGLKESAKKREHREEDVLKVKEQVLRLYARESTRRKINTVQYRNGKLFHDLATYTQWGHGFDGVFDRLGLHSWESGGVYLLVDASVDGVVLSQMTEARLEKIDAEVKRGIFIDFTSAKNEYVTSSDRERLKQIQEFNLANAGLGRDGLPQHFTIMLDEKTTLVIENSPNIKEKLVSTFTEGGNIRKELETFIPNESNNERSFYKMIDELVNRISTEEKGISHNDPMKVLIYLTRMLGDHPGKILEEIKNGTLKNAENAVKLHKRLKSLTPKGIATNDRVLGITRKRLQTMRDDYRAIKDKNMTEFYVDALKRLDRNMKDKTKRRNLKFVTFEDESEESKAFFDVLKSQEAAAKEKYGTEFDQSIFDEDNAELRKATKSRVDGEMYVTLDTMVAEMLGFGEGREAFETDKSGKIIGLKYGALKPNIHHVKIGKDGSVTVFQAKTAMKWHPRIEEGILNPRRLDGILFKSSNKINSVSSSKGGEGNPRRLELNLNDRLNPNTAKKDFLENYRKDNWIENLITVVKGTPSRNIDENIVEVAHKSFLIRSVARQHEPTLTRASLTFLDEASLQELSKWTHQGENLKKLSNAFGVIEQGPPGLTSVAEMLMGMKDDSHISDTIIDTIVRGGYIVPQAYEKTINQKLMAAASRAGNYTGEAREGAYSVMSAGNNLSRPWRTSDGVQRQYGGAGVSNYSVDKAVDWRSSAKPSFIWRIGQEEFMVYSDETIKNRGLDLTEGKLAYALLDKLGIDRKVLDTAVKKDIDTYDEKKRDFIAGLTPGQRARFVDTLEIPLEFIREIDNILKKVMVDTYKEISNPKESNGKTTMRDIITWLSEGFEKDADGNFVYKNSKTAIKKAVGNKFDYEVRQGENSAAFNKGVGAMKDIHKVLRKIQKHRSRNVTYEVTDNLKKISAPKKASTRIRVFEGIWVAKRDLRIPKDGIESVVVTKIEKIINKLRGTVSEMNGVDATLVQDADFDLDKSIEWWGMPVNMSKHIDKLAGFSHFAEGKRYKRQDVDFKMLASLEQGEDVDSVLRARNFEGKELEKMRGIIIGTHHILSFFQNFKVDNKSVMTDLKPGMDRPFMVKEHQFVSDGKSAGQFAQKNVDLVLGDFGKYGRYRIQLSEKGDMLGTINNVKEFAKMVIDAYNPKRVNPKNLRNVTDEIYFGTNGMFRIWDIIKKEMVEFHTLGVSDEVKERIRYDLIQPVKDIFKYMKEEVQMGGDNVRPANLWDYAKSLGRVRMDIKDIEMKYQEGVNFGGTYDWPINLTRGIKFIKNAITETEHPYLNFLRASEDMIGRSKQLEKGNPLADLIFVESTEILRGKDMQEKLQRVAATFVTNTSKALDLQSVAWAIRQIQDQRAFLQTKVPRGKDIEVSDDLYSTQYRDLGKELEAKEEIRDVLSHALTWDENIKNVKAVTAEKFFKSDELGTQITNKTKQTLLIYRKSDKNPIFEMVKPGKESFVRINGKDLIVSNPRRYEYVDTNEQMGLSGLFNAFSVPVKGLTPQERFVAQYRADETKKKFGDSMDVVLGGAASSPDWAEHSIRLIEFVNSDLAALAESTRNSPLKRESILTQYIYNMLAPRPDQQVQGVTSVLTNTGRFERRWRGPKYFRNDLFAKGIFHYLNSVANGTIRETPTFMQSDANKILHHVLGRYTKHVLKVFDPTLPGHIAATDIEYQYKSSERKSIVPPVSEMPDWVSKDLVRNQESAGLFLDYLLGIGNLSPRELYDISMYIGRDLALEAGASVSEGNAYIVNMAKQGKLGEVIEHAWRIETGARDKYGRKVEIGSIRQAISETKQARRDNFSTGHKQFGNNNGNVEEIIHNMFEEQRKGLCIKKGGIK